MATEEKASTSDEGVSWWSSWVQTAKEKSVSALNATTRDLAEFVTVVHRDTAQAVSGAASTIKVMVSGGDAEEEKKEPENCSKVETDGESGGGALSYDRSVTQVNMLRSSTDTYCTIPDGHAAQFLEWSAGFDLPGSQDTISLLLVESPDVRRLHTELVPAKVSYESFWHHYFYRVHLMEQEHAHRAAIMARAESQGKLIDWDEDEEEEDEEEARDRSGSSDSFICIGDETGVETTADDSMPNKDDTTTAHNVSQQQKQQQKETTSQEREKTKRKGGGNDSDSDWERWSD